MRKPLALRYLHIGKLRFERRIFGTACVYSEFYRVADVKHMANSHLIKVLPVN